MRPSIRRAIFLIVGLALVACAPAAPSPTSPPKAAPAEAKPAAPAEAKPAAKEEPKPAAKTEAKPAAKVDLTALYEAAKAEGKVVCYCSMNLADAPKIFPIFEARYPGVKIEHVRAGGEQLFQRLSTEAKTGRVLGDILETSAQNAYSAVTAGLLEPYDPPEGASWPPERKDRNNVWISTRMRTDVLGINTDQVKLAEAPQSYDELLDPKWKGKLMMESASITLFGVFRQQKFGGDLAKTKGLVLQAGR